MLTLLQAQPPVTTNSTELAVRVLGVLGILIVVLLVCGLLVRRFRHGLLGDSAASGAPPLLMEDLRAMKRRGEISDAEYERMRSRLVERLSGRSAQPLSVPRSATSPGLPNKGRPDAKSRHRSAGEAPHRPDPGSGPAGDAPPRPAPGE